MKKIFVSLFVLFLSIHSFAKKLSIEDLFRKKETSKAHYHFSLQRNYSRLPNRKCLICHKESCSKWKCFARKAIHIFIAYKRSFNKITRKVKIPWRKIATALIALGGGAFLAKKSRISNTSCNLSVVNDTKEEKKE